MSSGVDVHAANEAYLDASDSGGLQDKPSKVFESEVVHKYYGGENMPGAYSMFISLSQKTLEQMEGRLTCLFEAVHCKDFAQAIHYAHQLRGSFLMSGSPRLGDICGQIESQCLKGDLTGVQELIDDLLSLSHVFRSELTLFVSGVASQMNNDN